MAIQNLKRYIEVHKELYKHLRFEGDDIEVVLKGHLLLESLLGKILNSSVQNTKILSVANLSYHKLTCLVQAIHDTKCGSWVWKAVFNLNNIRNKLAHNLELPGIEEQIEDFIVFVRANGDGTIEFGNELDFSELSMAIVNVHRELWRLLDKLVA
ncbi:MAG: hypothetical protein PF450_07860 [Bacteroidales bacterium]|jgi:hypothetical protein|nr:hypothetical protein [Bacteroidales bacterium]